ncbi:Uu.00g111420.m01.CDS01 [Anthostomella pinea]|uniref:Uu.00g111420.m01.CDS01 n=1 Tax=Anthostomella pinea TaxID=933095 RepID=A0AAI8YGC4_9PEZI|nr:Uu.00g111420.m01.CDS01 [Anthostomella pinea]
MGLLYRAGAAALASLLAFTSVTNAQGFDFQDLGAQCPAQYNYQYLGCAPTMSQPFAFSPSGWDPSSGADNSKGYIQWDNGDFVNQTITPYFCSNVCRAHGFKYAALWDKGCNCGSSLSYTYPGAVAPVMLVPGSTETLCQQNAAGGDYGPCGGDQREYCGTNRGARIFVDPSFADERNLNSPAATAQSYQVLGCFTTANLPTSNEGVTRAQVASGPQCLSFCADLGMPFVQMIPSTSGVSGQVVDCRCGTEFGKGTQVATNVQGNACTLQCSAPNSGTACTAQDCCGASNGPFPIYVNPALMGCFTPIIPGVSDASAPGGFDCFPTPQYIAARATSSVSYVAATMSASARFVPTASPAANAFSIYACYQNTVIGSVFNTPVDSGLASGSVSVTACVNYCDTNGYTYAAVVGVPASQKCYCAAAGNMITGVTPNNAMQDCNQPCAGSTRENCGGNNGPLVYAKAAVAAGGPWAASFTASYSSTPVYACKNTGTYLSFL